MQENGSNSQRFDTNFFEGINSATTRMLSKRQEPMHAENARAGTIGSIEKRQGQTKYGTMVGGGVQSYGENYGLAKFLNNGSNQGVYRVVTAYQATVSNPVFIPDVYAPNPNILYVQAADYVNISEPTIFSRLDSSALILDGTSYESSIKSLNSLNEWADLGDTDANNIIGAQFDTTPVGGNLVVVNQRDYNRYIKEDGTTVIDSTQAGHLFNSPRASKCTFYKNRIYLADYMRSGVRYKTTIVRSSFPLGIVALANGDATPSSGHVSGAILEITDPKYFYSSSGMNSYEVYRGSTLITTLTVTAVNSTSVTVTHAGTPIILSADEIWVTGTYNGEKQYRWQNNSTSTGQDVKQYDTMKLSGGDEDQITVLESVGNVLVVANKNAFLAWNDYTLQNFDQGVGCVSKTGSVKLLGSLYFLHYSGVFSTNGAAPTLLSRKIDKYIKGATRDGLENAAAGYKDLSVFFAIGDVTLMKNDGSAWKVLPDVCLEYQTADQKWYVHTNVPAKQLITFISADGAEHLLMAHKGSGKSVKEFLVGNTDDGEAIFFRVDLPPVQLMKDQEVLANPIAVVTELERGTLVRCFVSLDSEDFYELSGDLKKGISFVKVTSRDGDTMQPVLCHWIQLSFRDGSPQICRLTQASLIYTPGTFVKPQ